MKKRIAIIIPAITAVLALLCFVLFFVTPTQAAKDEYARKRAAEIWSSVPSKGGSYATKVMIGVHTLNNGGTLQLNTVSDVFTGSVSLNNGVLTFSSDTKTSGSTYPTIVPNGALKVVLNGGDPRLQFDDDGAVKTYSPLLITTNATTYLHCEKMFTTNGDIVLYNGNGTDSTYSNGSESAELTLDLHPNNTGAENGVVGIHSGQKAGLAIKGSECLNKGYEIILGGTTIYANANATAQYGIIDNQSGSITFCQTGSGTITNTYNQLYADNNATHSAVRIAASAKADSCILFKNIGKLTITANKGNAVRNHCNTTASFVEKSSPYTHDGVNYTRKYNAYSNSVDTIVFDNTGSVTLETKNDHVFGWGQQLGVLFANNGNVRVRGTGQVTVKEVLKTFAIGPADKDAGGCGIAINVNNNENNPHAGLFVEENAKLSVIALGETSAANDTAMQAEFNALTITGSYAEQTLQSGRERLAATWVNYGQVNVSGNAQYASYAKRTGTSTGQCSALVIKIGKYVQSGSPNVLFYQENTSNNGIGMEIQSGNTISAALYDNNGTEHVFQLAEGPLPDHTETIQNDAGLIVNGGQLEVKSSNWGVRINNYNSLYGQDVRISDGIVLIKGNGRTIEGLSTPSTTQFQNAYHCNAIGNVDLGSKAYPSNMGSSNAGLAYIGDIDEKYTPNTLLSSAGINVTAVMGKTDGKTVIFPANATKDNIYYAENGGITARVMAKQGNTHTASSAVTVSFSPPDMASYVLVRENSGTTYMLGGADFADNANADSNHYKYNSYNSASGTIQYTPRANGNDELTINNVSGVQEIVAPTGSLTVKVNGTNTLNNPSAEGSIRVTYAGGDLNLVAGTGNKTLTATAKNNLLFVEDGDFSANGVTLNLTGDKNLIFTKNGEHNNTFTMTNVTMKVDQNQAESSGIVHYGKGDVTLTGCTITADLYENNRTTTLFTIGNRTPLTKTDYSAYKAKVTIDNTNITMTSSGVHDVGFSDNLLLHTNGGQLEVKGTSKITSDARLFYVMGYNATATFRNTAVITSSGSGGDTICVQNTSEGGTMGFTLTNSAQILIRNSYSCALRITADHPDGNVFTIDEKPNDTTQATINFTMDTNAVIDASGRGQVLYLKTSYGTLKGTVGDASSLTLRNTGLKTVPQGSTATTDTLYSALRIWANSRTADGYFTIKDDAAVRVSCDDKEVLNDNVVAAFDLYDFGDSGHKGVFTIQDRALLDADGSHAFITYDTVLNFRGGKVTARANESTGSVFFCKGAGVNVFQFFSGSEFFGTGNYGICEENSRHELTIHSGANIYIAGTTKARNNYRTATLVDNPSFYEGCAPVDDSKYIITGTMQTDTQITIRTFGGETFTLSWKGDRYFDSVNGSYKDAKKDITQIYLAAPGQVVFNNVNRSINGSAFNSDAKKYSFDLKRTVRDVSFSGSDVTVTLIGESRIWHQQEISTQWVDGGSNYLITVNGHSSGAGYGYNITITSTLADKGTLSLRGNDYVITTRGDMIVEGYATLNIESQTHTKKRHDGTFMLNDKGEQQGHAGNAIHAARQTDECDYFFRGHSKVNIGKFDSNWNMTENIVSGRGIYMAGAILRLHVTENSTFNIHTSDQAIYLLSDTTKNKELKDSGLPSELLVEIGGNSAINASSTGHLIALVSSCSTTGTYPAYTEIISKTLRLFGNATVNLKGTGASNHEIVFYNHDSGDNTLELRDFSKLNITRSGNRYTTCVAQLQYAATNHSTGVTTPYGVSSKNNLIRILDGSQISVSGSNANYVLEQVNHSDGENIIEIAGSETNKPTLNISSVDDTQKPSWAICQQGGYSGPKPHKANRITISSAVLNITADRNAFWQGGGALNNYGSNYEVALNSITIMDSELNLIELNDNNGGENGCFYLRAMENNMTISGNSVLNMKHNTGGIQMVSTNVGGNRLDILGGVTITAQKQSANPTRNSNIKLFSNGTGDNVMNVLETENGKPTLTLKDNGASNAIYLYHASSSAEEQNNNLVIRGATVDIDTSLSTDGLTGIFLEKRDENGDNTFLIEDSTVNIDASRWGIVLYHRQDTNMTDFINNVTYNNLTLRNSTVGINTGITGINLDIISQGGNNVVIEDNTILTIERNIDSNEFSYDYSNTSENYRRGIRMTDQYKGGNSGNRLTIRNGASISIEGTFYKGIDLDKEGSGTNEFLLEDASCKIDIAIPDDGNHNEIDTFALQMGNYTEENSKPVPSFNITNNRLIVHGNPETAAETKLDLKSSADVVTMMASRGSDTTNTVLFDGDASVNLVNTHDGTDLSRHSAINYSAKNIDVDILTTGKVYMQGKGSTWYSAAVYDADDANTAVDILITGTDVTVENYTQNTGDGPGVAWMLSDYGNQTMTIAENANVTFRGKFGGVGNKARPYGLFVSGAQNPGIVVVKDNATMSCEATSVDDEDNNAKWSAGLHLKNGTLTVQDNANVYAKGIGEGSTGISAMTLEGTNCSILIQGKGFLQAESTVGPSFTGSFWGAVYNYDNPATQEIENSTIAPINIMKDSDNDGMFVVKSNVALAIAPTQNLTQVVNAQQAAAMGLLKNYTITKEAETIPATGSMLLTIAIISAMVSACTLFFVLRDGQKKKTR